MKPERRDKERERETGESESEVGLEMTLIMDQNKVYSVSMH